MKSATRRAKKRWLGRHDRPGRRRLRGAAAAEEEEHAPGPAVGRCCAASACAPRRHIGMEPPGGGDRSGLGRVGRVGDSVAKSCSCCLLVCYMGRVPMRTAGGRGAAKSVGLDLGRGLSRKSEVAVWPSRRGRGGLRMGSGKSTAAARKARSRVTGAQAGGVCLPP